MDEIPQAFFSGPPPVHDDTIPSSQLEFVPERIFLSIPALDGMMGEINGLLRMNPWMLFDPRFERIQASLEDFQQKVQAFLDNPPTFHPDDCCCPDREQQAEPHGHTDTCAELMTARKALREATAEKALGEESDIPFNSALHDLAYRLFCIAKRERSTPLMQEAASYWMKYIGFSKGNDRFQSNFLFPLKAMEIIPFVLLYLERYEEVYAFIKFCFRRPEEGTTKTLTDDECQIAQTGRFPFSTEPGACLGNHLEYHRAAYESEYQQAFFGSDGEHTLSCLVALLFLLIRLSNDRATSGSLVDCLVMETHQGQRLEPIVAILKEMVEGNVEFKNSQAEQIQLLMDVIDMKSSLILPALIHPEPLQEYIRHHPYVYRKDYTVFKLCLDQVDDALRQALAFGSEIPEYNPKMDEDRTDFTRTLVLPFD